jgi:hypothetical protein
MNNVLVKFIFVSSVCLLSSCKNEPSNQDIKNSIREYFDGDQPYLYQKEINFREPTIVKIISAPRPKLKLVTFDVYWVGEPLDVQTVKILKNKKVLAEFDIEYFEKGTVDNPVAEKYTGHGIFNVSRSIWNKIGKNEIEFILSNENGMEYGDPFITKKPSDTKDGFQKYERIQ